MKFTFGSTGSEDEEEEELLEEGFEELLEDEALLEEEDPLEALLEEEDPLEALLEDELLLEELVPAEELAALEDEDEDPFEEELLLLEEDEVLLEELVGSLDSGEEKLEPPLPPQPLKRSVAAATPIIQLVFFINTSAEPRYPELGNRFLIVSIIALINQEKREIVKALSRKLERNRNETKSEPKPFMNVINFRDVKANESIRPSPF